jgi:hypothetical protein
VLGKKKDAYSWHLGTSHPTPARACGLRWVGFRNDLHTRARASQSTDEFRHDLYAAREAA